MARKEEALKAYIGLKRTINIIEAESKKYVSKYNLNMNEFAVMEILYHKGVCTTQEIKEGILIANSSTTYIVDKLCDKGYVQREFDTQDRRVINVELTDSGRKLMKDIFPPYAYEIITKFDQLSEQEIKQIRTILKKMNGLID